MKNCHICLFVVLLACAAAAQTDPFARKPATTPAATAAAQENARIELFRQQVERLNDQVNAMRQENEQVEQRVTQTEQQQRAIAALQTENAKLRDEVKNLRAEIKDVRDELAQVKADRETLRKQITDDIIARITTLIEKQNAKPPVRGNSASSATGGKETGRLHTVERGQTLSEIAAAYKSSTDIIVKANNLKNPDALRIGQELFIPDP